MIFLARMSDATNTPVIVGDFGEDGTVLVSTPMREVLRLDRGMIDTPVLSCPACLKPVIEKRDKKTGPGVAECPDHARHMYDKLYAASNDKKNYNRDSRKRMRKSAGLWLKKWQRLHTARMKADAELPAGIMRHPQEQRLLAEAAYINESFQPGATFTISKKE